MLFSSALFLVYFLPFFLLGHQLCPPRYRNYFILLGSLLFYAWGAPRFVFLLLLTSFIDFQLVRAMARKEDPATRKRFLIFSLVLNIGLLGIFKYGNFFLENFRLLDPGHPWISIGLPLGVSFFLFETITYVVDVYRGEQEPLDQFGNYLLYILFFPKLLAGPIVRYGEIAGQIGNPDRKIAPTDFAGGLFRFALGLGKKILIADVLGNVVGQYFQADPYTNNGLTNLVILLASLMHIYFDFSGYSDMALGLARMMGFHLPENFNNPFTAGSITEFWRRWHITLGSWFRNYLYIPLGGNRNGRSRMLINLAIVFLLCGFWHGANWNYIVWGGLHGAFLIIERMGLKRLLDRLPRAIGMLYVLGVVCFTFIFFRNGFSLSQDWDYFLSIFTSTADNRFFPRDTEFLFTLSFALFFSFFAFTGRMEKIQQTVFYGPRPGLGLYAAAIGGLSILFVCLSYVAWSPFNPFVYFRF